MSLNYDILEDDENIEVEDDSVPAECFATKDYSVFKWMNGNRDVSEKHVKNLMASMKRNNLIKYQTITVNEDFEIVDGQHRFEAAKRLGIHVHYKVKYGANYKTAGILNHASEEWKFLNYLENFSKNEHADYIKLEKFQNQHDISLKRFCYLISKEQKKIFEEKFRTGEFTLIDDLDLISNKITKIHQIIKFLDSIILIDNKKFLHTDNFFRALYKMMEKDLDMDKFKDKLSLKYQSIRQMSSYKDYLKLMTDIYNYKMKQRIK